MSCFFYITVHERERGQYSNKAVALRQDIVYSVETYRMSGDYVVSLSVSQAMLHSWQGICLLLSTVKIMI